MRVGRKEATRSLFHTLDLDAVSFVPQPRIHRLAKIARLSVILRERACDNHRRKEPNYSDWLPLMDLERKRHIGKHHGPVWVAPSADSNISCCCLPLT